jgi:RNA polymerase sigma-70 factor (ECF subfamily)
MKATDGKTNNLRLVSQSQPRPAAVALAQESAGEIGNDDGADQAAAAAQQPTEESSLVERARRNDARAFEVLMRRNNQRVYRVVRSVIDDATEIEDIMQHAYLQAFTHLEQYSGAAQWSTWLCRIAINEAKARLRKRSRFLPLEAVSEEAQVQDAPRSDAMNPEQTLAGRELTQMVEEAIDRLPELYRSVLMLREVEGMSTNDTAQVLDVEPDVVKTRLHRARAALRSSVEERLGEGMKNAYEFGNARCDQVVAAVLAKLERNR